MSLLGAGAINLGRHIGLQQLEAMAAATRAFLGPNKSYKFIQDEASGDAALVCSCYRLLEQLDLRNSVEQLLHETTRAHQEALHSGTGALVFLAGVWSRVALECLHKGITIPHIIAAMSKGLELCMEACRRNVVTVEEVVRKGALLKQPSGVDCKKTEDGLATGPSLNTGGKESTQSNIRTLNGVFNLDSIKEKLPTKHRIKLKHSRHFNPSSTETEGAGETSSQQNPKSFDIALLAEAVSHGCEASMRLVVEASRIQFTHAKHGDHSPVLDVDRLVTCPLPGLSEEHSCVLHGYVLLSCIEQASLVKHYKERTLKIGLINGDLCERYRHVGFNGPKNVTHVSDCSGLTGISREEEWIRGALEILLNLSVDVLLVSGVVNAQLKDHCLNHSILVIEQVKASILKDFAMTTGAIPISYVTQFSEQCVGTGVCVNMVREYRSEGKTFALLNVAASGTTLVTAVIASSVHAKLQSLVDQFWSCAYRVHHALKDGKLLPGAGAAELLCIHQLYRHIDMSQSAIGAEREAARATAPYETTILRLMADGWMDYISTLMVNAGQVVVKAQAWTCIAQHLKDFEGKGSLRTEKLEAPLEKYFHATVIQGERESEVTGVEKREREVVGVYDNVTVKFEAWRRALDLVLLVLQTDTEIIIGISEKESQRKDVVFL